MLFISKLYWLLPPIRATFTSLNIKVKNPWIIIQSWAQDFPLLRSNTVAWLLLLK